MRRPGRARQANVVTRRVTRRGETRPQSVVEGLGAGADCHHFLATNSRAGEEVSLGVMQIFGEIFSSYQASQSGQNRFET